MRSAVAAALLLATPLLGYHSADDPSFRQLLDEHRWFELRDAIGGRSVPPLYAGAVAVAFHQTRDAERLLRRAVRDARTSTEANEARELLAGVYMRASHSAELVRTLDEMLAAAPDRSDLRNVRNGFEGFRRAPDQTARLNRRPFPCTVTARMSRCRRP